MSSGPPIDPAEFDAKVRALAERDGVELLLAIPGVWEHVTEALNNDAIRALEGEPCPDCGGDKSHGGRELIPTYSAASGAKEGTDICENPCHDWDREDESEDDDDA